VPDLGLRLSAIRSESQKPFSVSKSKRDPVAQQIIFAPIVLVADPKAFDLFDEIIARLALVDDGLAERMVRALDLFAIHVTGNRQWKRGLSTAHARTRLPGDAYRDRSSRKTGPLAATWIERIDTQAPITSGFGCRIDELAYLCDFGGGKSTDRSGPPNDCLHSGAAIAPVQRSGASAAMDRSDVMPIVGTRSLPRAWTAFDAGDAPAAPEPFRRQRTEPFINAVIRFAPFRSGIRDADFPR
jgi:hypothetical protein